MSKYIFLLLIFLVSNSAIASQPSDTLLPKSTNYLSLRKMNSNKVSYITIGSKVIVQTNSEEHVGILLNVGEESLTVTVKAIGQEPREIEIYFGSINVVIEHYGYMYRALGKLMEVAGVITATLSLGVIGDYPEIAVPSALIGAGVFYVGHLIRGKKYKLTVWEIIPN